MNHFVSVYAGILRRLEINNFRTGVYFVEVVSNPAAQSVILDAPDYLVLIASLKLCDLALIDAVSDQIRLDDLDLEWNGQVVFGTARTEPDQALTALHHGAEGELLKAIEIEKPIRITSRCLGPNFPLCLYLRKANF